MLALFVSECSHLNRQFCLNSKNRSNTRGKLDSKILSKKNQQWCEFGMNPRRVARDLISTVVDTTLRTQRHPNLSRSWRG